MKSYKLKDEITEEMLQEKGFMIERVGYSTWAVRGGEDAKIVANNKMVIIKLEPPERYIKFRFQSVDDKYNLLEEIQDIVDWFII